MADRTVPKAVGSKAVGSKAVGSKAIGSRRGTSLGELKTLETMQFFLDAALEILARAPRRAAADPIPFLH
jgi:hypothetical protein